MKITAAICTYNREKYLPQVLNSLLNQSLATDQFEIILVDNNSPGNTKEIFDDFKKANPSLSFHYFLETNQGLSFARNRCIQEAHYELITFIDDDAFLDENYLSVVVNEFNENEKIAAIGGEILLHYEDIIPDWENKYLNSLLGFYQPSTSPFIYATNYSKKDYPRGSNMSFRMEVFHRIGNFNIELGRIGGNLLGGEEKDLFYRIYALGDYRVKYVPTAIVYHCVPMERTKKDFIIRQALGTGSSERIRAKNENTFVMALFREGIKWLGSLVLCVQFILKNQWPKGKMIVLFRYWVSRGLLFENR